MFFGAQAVGALARVAISLRDPVSYRLGRRLELPSEVSRCTSGLNQLDHLLSECRRVRRSRLRHRGLLLLLAKRISVRGTEATSNNKLRVIARRAYGFHSHGALISMLFLCCGGIELAPPLPTRV